VSKHKEKILKLRAEGKTYNEIKEITGASKGTIAYHCGEGQKQKTRERTKSHRRRVSYQFRQIKEDSGCVDCGEKYPHWLLDWDHVPERGRKKGSPNQLAARHGMKIGMQEMQKCDIVCPNCHRIRTYNRNQCGTKE